MAITLLRRMTFEDSEPGIVNAEEMSTIGVFHLDMFLKSSAHCWYLFMEPFITTEEFICVCYGVEKS